MAGSDKVSHSRRAPPPSLGITCRFALGGGLCRDRTKRDQIAEGDKVVTRMTSYGKHEGDLPGAPRTDHDLKMTSITIHRIAGGKLVEKWSEKDVVGF
jgi:hypothetical protein